MSRDLHFNYPDYGRVTFPLSIRSPPYLLLFRFLLAACSSDGVVENFFSRLSEPTGIFPHLPGTAYKYSTLAPRWTESSEHTSPLTTHVSSSHTNNVASWCYFSLCPSRFGRCCYSFYHYLQKVAKQTKGFAKVLSCFPIVTTSPKLFSLLSLLSLLPFTSMAKQELLFSPFFLWDGWALRFV